VLPLEFSELCLARLYDVLDEPDRSLVDGVSSCSSSPVGEPLFEIIPLREVIIQMFGE
jgi:hypothetical protein